MPRQYDFIVPITEETTYLHTISASSRQEAAFKASEQHRRFRAGATVEDTELPVIVHETILRLGNVGQPVADEHGDL